MSTELQAAAGFDPIATVRRLMDYPDGTFAERAARWQAVKDELCRARAEAFAEAAAAVRWWQQNMPHAPCCEMLLKLADAVERLAAVPSVTAVGPGKETP